MYTLLIADDEHLEREALDLMVRKSNLPLRSIKVRNGREAVEAAQTHEIDIALLDIRMPGISGLEAAKRIAGIAPRCRIVFLTAWDSFDFAQEALRIGAKDYLVKPATVQQVITLLTRLTNELEEERASTRGQGVDEIRKILKQFNRSFFASLKYGIVPHETMETYFSLEGIVEKEGLALVFDGNSEANLSKILEGRLKRTSYKACYFPTVDRISVLLFSTRAETLAIGFESQHVQLGCPTCHMGMGRPFHSYEEIPKALREASQAYLVAIRNDRSLVDFDQIQELDSSFASEQVINDVETRLVEAVMSGNLTEGRRLAHEAQDLIALRYSLETQQFVDRYYEMVLVATRSIRAAIHHFSYEPLQKSSPMEMERYFMDFIDSASKAIETDRKDKYVRIFQEVETYMGTHYAQQLSLEQMASQFNLSTSYFSRLFKEYIGESFVDHLTSCRMKIAKQMIRTGIKVHKVAELTGFSDYSYFSRVFRSHEGISPREYQKNYK